MGSPLEDVAVRPCFKIVLQSSGVRLADKRRPCASLRHNTEVRNVDSEVVDFIIVVVGMSVLHGFRISLERRHALRHLPRASAVPCASVYRAFTTSQHEILLCGS